MKIEIDVDEAYSDTAIVIHADCSEKRWGNSPTRY